MNLVWNTYLPPKKRKAFTNIQYDKWVVVSNVCYLQLYLGRWSNLTNMFQLGWNWLYVSNRSCLTRHFYNFLGHQSLNSINVDWWPVGTCWCFLNLLGVIFLSQTLMSLCSWKRWWSSIYTFPETNLAPKKWCLMFGRLLSFWDGNFSEVYVKLLGSNSYWGGVYESLLKEFTLFRFWWLRLIPIYPRNLCFLQLDAIGICITVLEFLPSKVPTAPPSLINHRGS